MSDCDTLPPAFMILERSVASYFYQILPKHDHPAHIDYLKSIYSVFFEGVERDLRYYVHLQLNKVAIAGLSPEQADLLHQNYPLLQDLSLAELQDYLAYVTELRGLCTHFGNWFAPIPTGRNASLLESLHFPLASVSDNKLTLFGILAVLVPLSSVSGIDEVSRMLFRERECLGLEGKAMGSNHSQLARILNAPIKDKPISRPFVGDKDSQKFYAYFSKTFREHLTLLFLGSERFCIATITKNYPKEQWNDLVYGNTTELMSSAHYLDEQDQLKRDILILRNAIFHGYYLEEDSLMPPHEEPLTLAFAYDVLSRWRAALKDPQDIAALDKRVRPMSQSLLNCLYLACIEFNLKLQLLSQVHDAKAYDYADKVNRFYSNIANLRLPGGAESLTALWASYRGKPADFFLDANKFSHPGAPKDVYLSSPLIFRQYHADSSILVEGCPTRQIDLYLLDFPSSLKLTLAKLTDSKHRSFVAGQPQQINPFVTLIPMSVEE